MIANHRTVLIINKILVVKYKSIKESIFTIFYRNFHHVIKLAFLCVKTILTVIMKYCHIPEMTTLYLILSKLFFKSVIS